MWHRLQWKRFFFEHTTKQQQQQWITWMKPFKNAMNDGKMVPRMNEARTLLKYRSINIWIRTQSENREKNSFIKCIRSTVGWCTLKRESKRAWMTSILHTYSDMCVWVCLYEWIWLSSGNRMIFNVNNSHSWDCDAWMCGVCVMKPWLFSPLTSMDFPAQNWLHSYIYIECMYVFAFVWN